MLKVLQGMIDAANAADQDLDQAEIQHITYEAAQLELDRINDQLALAAREDKDSHEYIGHYGHWL